MNLRNEAGYTLLDAIIDKVVLGAVVVGNVAAWTALCVGLYYQ